jgi:Fe-S-cluster-containing hydrogenase component 2
MKILKFDPEKCTGCLSCQLACSFQRLQLYNPERAAIKVKIRGLNTPLLTYCRYCVNPPCIEACKFEAMEMVNRVVEINQDKCTGCGLCVEKCPFNAIFFEEEGEYKCDQCEGQFKCVQVCTTGAIMVVERRED